MEITALRDDVLRVRVGPEGKLPEDASWAVLPEARTAKVTVTASNNRGAAGFKTAKLIVSVDRATMALKVTDLDGHVIDQDGPGRPVEYYGGGGGAKGFRVTKVSPPDEHYFALGDKVGPLDRRNEAFTMWNTDSFGFQESTDPIYKSIPFVLTMNEGRAAGLFRTTPGGPVGSSTRLSAMRGASRRRTGRWITTSFMGQSRSRC